MFLKYSITCRGFLLAIAAAMWVLPVIAHCAASTSYQLTAGTIDRATRSGLASETYQMNINAVTWRQLSLGSESYRIVPVDGAMQSSSISSSTSSEGESDTGSSSSFSSSTATNRRSRPVQEPVLPDDTFHGAASSAGASASKAVDPEAEQVPPASETDATALPIFDEAGFLIHPPIFTNERAFDIVQSESGSHSCNDNEIIDRAIFPSLRIFFAFIMLIAVIALSMLPRSKARRKKNRALHLLLATIICVALLGLLLTVVPNQAYAADSTPQAMVYNGQLLNAAGQPVTEAQSIRFSYWTSSDAVSGDTTETGEINQSAPAYAGWQETHTVTPDVNGYFSVELGRVTPLPDMTAMPAATLMSLFLQVDVKPSAAPDTSYELLDVDPTNTQLDRSSVLSVPFALNADRVDQRHVGTGSGDIIILGSGGVLPMAAVPAGTHADIFTVDADGDAGGDIILQFGSLLQKTLLYSAGDGTFRFNDSVDIQGNLTVSGLINGMDLNNILGSADALRVASGGGLNINVFGGGYRLNGTVVNYDGGSIAVAPNANQAVFFDSGGLTVSQTGFPTNASYIPLAEVQTSDASVVTITDRRVLQNDDRESTRVQTFSPGFEKAAYEADGSDNVGQLSVGHDNASRKNFYRWTSTRPTLQDYDIILRVPLSALFVRWLQGGGRHPLTLEYRSVSDDPAENSLSVEVFDTAGAPVTLSGSVTGLASSTWRTTVIDFAGAQTWTPEQEMIVRIKTSAKLDGEMHLGSLQLSSVDLAR